MEIMIGVSGSPDRAGGISTYSKELAICLRTLGHSIHYVCPRPDSNEWFSDNDITFIPVDEGVSQVQQCAYLHKYIAANGIELIINNDNSLLQSIAPLVKCPFLAVCHMESRSIAAMACANNEWCDYIVAISYDMQERIVRKYGLNPANVPIVFCGVESAAAKRSTPDSRTGAPAPLVCLFSGHYSWHKGADLFVDFLTSDLVPDNTEYFWFGDVPEKVRKRIENLPYVKHIGRVSRTQFLAALCSADVLLFPSRQEGCPMAVLEAMDCGVVPVVSNGRGAMRHLVTHGKDGFVCSTANWVAESAAVLRRLSENRDLTRSYGRAAIKTCRERFTIRETARALLALAERPTVDRSRAQRQTKIYRWHRPTGIGRASQKASLVDRICYRAGMIKVAGVLKVEEG